MPERVVRGSDSWYAPVHELLVRGKRIDNSNTFACAFAECSHDGHNLTLNRFGAFLFGGFLIPLRDLFWPFELFYHIMPLSYYARTMTFQVFKHTSFDACTGDDPDFAVCVDSTDGLDVLDGLGKVVPLFSSDDQTGFDMMILIAIGLVFKVLYIAGVAYKTRQGSKFLTA